MEAHALILDPAAPVPAAAKLAERALGGIAGKVVGFIDNTKPNFDLLADDMAELLVREHAAAAVMRYRKRAPSDGAGAAVLEEIAQKVDLVIAGSGD
ncbi:MAG: hypothetical protein IT531_00885 [Burkholderiales bacterium]|nr:hypothetical protein [Burkholderiales bacterium]